MGKAPVCAAVDWGTTNFRLWLMDVDGSVLAARQSAEGVRACLPDRFAAVVEKHLEALQAPANLPVIVAGMAGARGAWQEARYLETPARLDALHEQAVRVSRLPRDVAILPGVCQREKGREDVMRGEETQLAGASAQGMRAGVFCLPGTHSKWAWLEGGRLSDFRTFMTGELFALLSEHSVLSEMVAEGEGATSSASFTEAVSEMLASGAGLTGRLFSIRAAALVGSETAPDARARLSGLLIGAEVAAMREVLEVEPRVRLIANGPQAHAYEAALSLAGIQADILDGMDLVRQGLHQAALALWPERSSV